jgi:HAMP domain-containing protein
MQDVDRNVAQTWRLAALVIATALLGIVSLIYWFTHRIVVVKLIEVLKAMETVAAGDNSLRLKATRRDEIGDMARAFNHMNQNLLQTWEQLRDDERNKLNTVIHSAGTGIVVTDGAHAHRAGESRRRNHHRPRRPRDHRTRLSRTVRRSGLDAVPAGRWRGQGIDGDPALAWGASSRYMPRPSAPAW